MGKGGGNKSKWKARSSTHHCGGTRLERSETYLFRESLAVHEVEMEFDLKQFDSTGTVSITPYPSDLPQNRAKPAGMAEIVDEFYNGKSARAKDYMQWFKSRVVDLPSSQRQAELASKLIELSILLHPRNDELGFPVDVVQLRRKSGVFTRWLKPTCRPSE
jgi:hypothetical protein